MKSLLSACLVLLFVVVIGGCGGRSNEVIVAPEVDPVQQQKASDDYDKQNAEDSKNYK
jgi:hypothetical protein